MRSGRNGADVFFVGRVMLWFAQKRQKLMVMASAFFGVRRILAGRGSQNGV